ncbi:MAG: ribonuclease HII, partial [Gammaproteobacteria bacterium GWE2_37_16]
MTIIINKAYQNFLIAGVDEAGRGPLAGPVFAAAVILNPLRPIDGLMDSKMLSEKRREALFPIIQENALAFAISRAEVEEIDELNILQATLLAMQRAICALSLLPEHILVDGDHLPKIPHNAETVINGDQLVPSIGAASILAKVSRDRVMFKYAEIYPQYGFDGHKGYGTKKHLVALKQFGASPIHRLSFAPVRLCQ